MISGVVKPTREPAIRLDFRGTNGVEINLEAVVDTVVSEYISLSQQWIIALALPLGGTDTVILADGSSVQVDHYDCIVIWDGQARSVQAYSAEGVPLVGMSLMDDYLLTVDAKIGGMVTLTFNP